jgi:hypothetical protein
MKNYDLIGAANKAISLVEGMTDEEFLAALENCDSSLAYAVQQFGREGVFSTSETSFKLLSYALERSIYLKLSADTIGAIDAIIPTLAMNDSNYALAA